MNKRIILALALVCVIAGGLVVAFNPGKDGAPSGTASGAPSGAAAGQTDALPAVKASAEVIADAKVVPAKSASLQFPTGGVVEKVLVAEGGHVQAGQLIAQLGRGHQLAALAQAQADLDRAVARLAELKAGARKPEIDAAKAALDIAEAQLARVKIDSAPLQVAIAQAEVRRAQAQYDLVRAGVRPETIAAAEADVAAARAAIRQAELQVNDRELRAPYAGTIASIDLREGEYVSGGVPVVRIADVSAWEIETSDLTELSVVRIKEGDPVKIKLDALPDLQLTGRVVRIKPYGENKNGDITYTVRIKPDKHDHRLRWNMTASVTIQPR